MGNTWPENGQVRLNLNKLGSPRNVRCFRPDETAPLTGDAQVKTAYGHGIATKVAELGRGASFGL